MSNIHAGTGANNVIPGELVIDFNFRFSTESTPEGLQSRLEEVLHQHGLSFHIDWTLGGRPFLTRRGPLVDAMAAAIKDVTGLETELSTTGAPPTAVSSPRSALRWSNLVRSTPASTKSTSTWPWPTSNP
jgi:acetylornithine deacetylase/succinyl-diaminopimelate desuccinylase-like protein